MMPQWFKAFQLQRQHQQRRQRVVRYFDCTWQSASGPRRARVSSLSPTGCFVEDRSWAPPQWEIVPELTIALPTGPVCVQGTVIERMPGLGFAVRFRQLDAAACDRLATTIRELRAQTPP